MTNDSHFPRNGLPFGSPARRLPARRFTLETLETRRALATLISGQVIDDLNANGSIDAAEPGQAGVQVYVDANGNSQLDLVGSILEPDDFADGAPIDGSALGVSMTVADENNVPLAAAPTIVARNDEFASTGSRVFARDVSFFNHFFRLRIDFNAPVSSVQINFTGSLDFAGQEGRLEAYSADGTLLDSYETGSLLHFQYETMDVSSDPAEIAYVTAFTKKEEQLTGRLDSLRINGSESELWTLTDANGEYTLSVGQTGVYPVKQIAPQDFAQTLPTGHAGRNVLVNEGQTVGDIDFANAAVVAGGWQNPIDPLDVDGDGGVFPIDALLIINELNLPVYRDPVSGLLPPPPDPVPSYFDVDGDGFAVPTDAILVINFLNTGGNLIAAVPAEASGESSWIDAADQVFGGASLSQLLAATLADEVANRKNLIQHDDDNDR